MANTSEASPSTQVKRGRGRPRKHPLSANGNGMKPHVPKTPSYPQGYITLEERVQELMDELIDIKMFMHSDYQNLHLQNLELKKSVDELKSMFNGFLMQAPRAEPIEKQPRVYKQDVRSFPPGVNVDGWGDEIPKVQPVVRKDKGKLPMVNEEVKKNYHDGVKEAMENAAARRGLTVDELNRLRKKALDSVNRRMEEYEKEKEMNMSELKEVIDLTKEEQDNEEEPKVMDDEDEEPEEEPYSEPDEPEKDPDWEARKPWEFGWK